MISQHAQQLAEICRRHHVKRLERFGSAVSDNFNPNTSDIDFLVDYRPFHQDSTENLARTTDCR